MTSRVTHSGSPVTNIWQSKISKISSKLDNFLHNSVASWRVYNSNYAIRMVIIAFVLFYGITKAVVFGEIIAKVYERIRVLREAKKEISMIDEYGFKRYSTVEDVQNAISSGELVRVNPEDIGLCKGPEIILHKYALHALKKLIEFYNKYLEREFEGDSVQVREKLPKLLVTSTTRTDLKQSIIYADICYPAVRKSSHATGLTFDINIDFFLKTSRMIMCVGPIYVLVARMINSWCIIIRNFR